MIKVQVDPLRDLPVHPQGVVDEVKEKLRSKTPFEKVWYKVEVRQNCGILEEIQIPSLKTRQMTCLIKIPLLKIQQWRIEFL